jgi:hypothetical protein
MMIYEGIKEIETEGSEHVAISISIKQPYTDNSKTILTDISDEKTYSKESISNTVQDVNVQQRYT